MILFAHDVPIEGALAMALDEVLLERVSEPVLRTWRWEATTLSIGCFVRTDETAVICGDLGADVPVVRRWTGGGCVLHEKGRDLSYSLIVPRGSALASQRPAESYRWIHGRLAAVLEECGIAVGLAGGGRRGDAAFRDCFRSPVPFDLIAAEGGAKVSGAGQKRTRQGMLHQGNVRARGLPDDFPGLLARALFPDVRAEGLPGGVLEAARVLRGKKYASADWTEKF